METAITSDRIVKAMVFSMEKKHLQSISAYLGIVNNTNLSFSGLSSPYVSL